MNAKNAESPQVTTFAPGQEGADAVDVTASSAAKPETALSSMIAAGREPLRIWKVKGPKLVGGEIEAILCQDDNTIVLAHTLPSGKFSVFAKVAR